MGRVYVTSFCIAIEVKLFSNMYKLYQGHPLSGFTLLKQTCCIMPFHPSWPILKLSIEHMMIIDIRHTANIAINPEKNMPPAVFHKYQCTKHVLHAKPKHASVVYLLAFHQHY